MKKKQVQVSLFEGGQDSPLFTGTPVTVYETEFAPQEEEKQTSMFGSICAICFGTGVIRKVHGRFLRELYCSCPAGSQAKNNQGVYNATTQS